MKMLADKGEYNSMLFPELVNEQIIEFKKLCVKVRQAWALAVFSGSTRQSLERYFTYHLQLLSDLSGKLYPIPPNPVPERSCPSPENYEGIFANELDALTLHLLHFFRDYPDQTIQAPVTFARKFVKDLDPRVTAVINALPLSFWPGPLKSIILSYIERMTSPALGFTFGDLLYFEKFISGITPAIEQPGELPNILMELEFNHLGVLVWFQEESSRSLKGKSSEKKLEFVRRQAAWVRVHHKAGKAVYDPILQPLTAMFAGWLSEEEKVLGKTACAAVAARCTAAQKIRLPLSVVQVACFLRLFLKDNLAGTVPLTELFDFVCSAFSTKKANDLSPGGLSKAYYSIGQVTAAEVKAMLAKMISRINHDYFPAWAAIGVLICAR